MFFRFTLLACAFLALGFSDTLYLKSGASVQGSYAGGDTRQVRIVVGDHVETYQIEEIQRMDFSGPRAQLSDGMRDLGTRPGERGDVPPPTSYTAGLEIPSGTNLIVKLTDNIDSERDSVGATYRATVDEPVMVNGQSIVPRGADVRAKLITQSEAGRLTGSSSLTLDLVQIQVNGRMVDIVTSEVTQTGSSRTKGTAVRGGGGALVGAILGGVIGGGKGAAVGALTGGALGVGSQVITKGQKVKIPSETRLSFLLQQPVRY